MQVETYDMREMDIDLTVEPDAEAVALIEELGLDGQKGLVNDEGERQPYNRLTADQLLICQNLFPTYTKLESYKEGPIPYRVLKEAKNAKDHFQYLYVLYNTPAEIKDPILVGSNEEFYRWGGARSTRDYAKGHLIARWGDALEDWSVLLAKALERKYQSGVEKFNTIMAHFEGISKGIKEGHIKINPELDPKSIIDAILEE